MYLVPTFEFLVLCFLSHPHPIRPYLGTCSVNRAIYLFKFAVDRACLLGLKKIEVSSFIWGCKSGSHLLITACIQLHCDGGRNRSRRGASCFTKNCKGSHDLLKPTARILLYFYCCCRCCTCGSNLNIVVIFYPLCLDLTELQCCCWGDWTQSICHSRQRQGMGLRSPVHGPFK